MKMMTLSTVILLIAATATLAQDVDIGIGMTTVPLRYLKRFPVGEPTADDVISQIGIPNDVMELGGRTMWTFELFGDDPGLAKLTFVIVDGVVFDVILTGRNWRTPRTARGEQGLDP